MNVKTLYIHQAVSDDPLVRRIMARTGIPVEIVDGAQTVYARLSRSNDPIRRGKEVLLLTRNKGRFIKKCPGTRFYNCCGYQILHVGSFCSMDCTYCILQSYFHPPVRQLFVNHDDLFAELAATSASPEIKRVGTGEFTDSLIWESWTDLTPRLVQWYGSQTETVLELKTKTVAIDSLRNLDHRRKTIVAWSLNSPAVIASEERGTASLAARFRAAKTSASWGYPIAFHFDPLVLYDGCEQDYIAVIDQIFNHVSPANIVWISLGGFRFMPPLKAIVQRRFPASKIPYGEFVPGMDGKMRYFKPLRIRLYRRLVDAIRRHDPGLTVYFCMEDDEVWEKVMGFGPAEKGGLAAMLDASAARHCGLSEK